MLSPTLAAPSEEKELHMSAYAAAAPLALPRIAFKRPKFDRDRLVEITRDWWVECKDILQRASPLIMVPSPLRDALARV